MLSNMRSYNNQTTLNTRSGTLFKLTKPLGVQTPSRSEEKMHKRARISLIPSVRISRNVFPHSEQKIDKIPELRRLRCVRLRCEALSGVGNVSDVTARPASKTLASCVAVIYNKERESRRFYR